MDAKKRKIYIFIIFAAVAIWGINYFLDSGKKKKSVTSSKAETRTEVKTPIVQSKSVDVDFSEYASLNWGSDPFFRGTISENNDEYTIEPEKEWKLGGILYSDLNPAAVINKKIVYQGDIVEGARVVEIKRETVILEKDGTSLILGIKKEKS